MVALSTIVDLPPDDDEAFLAFENAALVAFANDSRTKSLASSLEPHWREYMTDVREAAEEFGVERVAALEILPPVNSEEFDHFRQEVLTATARLKFRVARRMRKELIEPDTSDRERIRFRVEQLRAEIDGSSLPQAKKHALNAKLEELEKQFEGKKVNRAAVLVILTACAALVHQSQEVLLKGPQTIVAIMDTIGMVIGKEEERHALLERYRKPLAIEDKSASTSVEPVQPESNKFQTTLDEEIPL